MKHLWLFDWMDAFRDTTMDENIPEKIQRIRGMNWAVASFGGVMNLAGFLLMLWAPDLRGQLVGLYLALASLAFMVIVAVNVNFYVTRYWIVWERQNRLAKEQRQVEAADL